MSALGGPFPFNAFAKYMKSQNPEGCVRLFSGLKVAFAEEMDSVTLAPPSEVSMDGVWRVITQDGEEVISLVEFQRTNELRFIRRLAMYSYILEYQHELKVHSSVVYMGDVDYTMPRVLRGDRKIFSYKLYDLRNTDPNYFLSHDHPALNSWAIFNQTMNPKELAKRLSRILEYNFPSDYDREVFLYYLTLNKMNLRAQEDFVRQIREAYPTFDPESLLFYEKVKKESEPKVKLKRFS